VVQHRSRDGLMDRSTKPTGKCSRNTASPWCFRRARRRTLDQLAQLSNQFAPAVVPADARRRPKPPGSLVDSITDAQSASILWDFPRATWQYDVMVGIILAFIFFAPRDWFRTARIPNASSIAMLPRRRGAWFFLWTGSCWDGIPENQRVEKLTQVLRPYEQSPSGVTRVEPILNSEEERQGYLAFARPHRMTRARFSRFSPAMALGWGAPAEDSSLAATLARMDEAAPKLKGLQRMCRRYSHMAVTNEDTVERRPSR